jgi:DNA-directed RNA polymerase subunit F
MIFNRKVKSFLVLANIATLALYAIAQSLHITPLIAVLGFISTLFLPGLNITSVFFRNSTYGNKLYISVIISIFFTPFTWLLYQEIVHRPLNLYAYLLLPSLSVIFPFIYFKVGRPQFSLQYKQIFNFFKVHWIFLIFAIFFVVLHSYTVSRSIVIDNGDTNYFLDLAQTTIQQGAYEHLAIRPLSVLFLSGTSIVSTISTYNLSRWWFIFFQIIAFVPLYILTCKTRNSIFIKAIVLGFALAVPVINLEIDQFRPQSILFIALPAIIYFLGSYSKEKSRNYLFMALFICFTGLFFYELFAIPAIIVFLFVVFSYRKWLFAHPWKAIFLTMWIVATAYPYISNFRFITIFSSDIFGAFANQLKENHGFRWWFLNNQQSVVGANVSWIGPLNVIKYYAYYVSPAILLVFALLLYQRKNFFKQYLYLRITLIFMAIFFTISEILPRFYIQYLPERAWLFFDIVALMIFPAILPPVVNSSRKIIKISIMVVLVLAIVGGVGGTIYISKQRGGLISQGEIASLSFFKNIRPNSAVVISQDGNTILIRNYAHQTPIMPSDDFFLNQDFQKSQLYTSIQQINSIMAQDYIDRDKKEVLRATQDFIASSTQEAHDHLTQSFQVASTRITNSKLSELSPESKKEVRSIYIMYSFDKAKHYLATRPYFVARNFFNAKLEKFENPAFKVVYSSSSVIIWEIQPRLFSSL